MSAIPISRPISQAGQEATTALQRAIPASVEPHDLTHVVAATTMLVGGLLLLTGRRKAGLAVGAAGTAIALLEHQDAVKTWWSNLPGYLLQAQTLLDKAEDVMEEAVTRGRKLQGFLHR